MILAQLITSSIRLWPNSDSLQFEPQLDLLGLRVIVAVFGDLTNDLVVTMSACCLRYHLCVAASRGSGEDAREGALEVGSELRLWMASLMLSQRSFHLRDLTDIR